MVKMSAEDHVTVRVQRGRLVVLERNLHDIDMPQLLRFVSIGLRDWAGRGQFPYADAFLCALY